MWNVKVFPVGVGRTFRKQMRAERESSKREISTEEKDVPTCSYPVFLACALLFCPLSLQGGNHDKICLEKRLLASEL